MNNSPRWLVAVTEYAGLTGYTGGIGRHYAALLPALVQCGVAVELIVFADGPPLPGADLQGVDLIGYHNTAAVTGLRLLAQRALVVRRAYGRRRYDRVFLPEWAALGAALPASAPLLTNLATSMALAHQVAGLRPSDFSAARRPGIAAQQLLEARQIRRSAGLIAISTAMLDRTRVTNPRLPPSRVVRNCVDVDRVATVAGTADLPPGWPHGDGPVVLFLGRLERRKGVVEAVRAFARVASEFPAATLVLAGASGDSRFEPDHAELLSYLPPAVHERVVWLGHVSGDSLYRGIHEATITLCPSRWEGFGNVALEAKAIGSAMVCTTGSGFDDFCSDGIDCLMVPPRDEVALAAAACKLLADAELRKVLGRVAAGRVGRFAPGPVAEDLIRASNELSDEGSAPR